MKQQISNAQGTYPSRVFLTPVPKKNTATTENIEKMIRNLKFRQAKLKLKVYRQARRLRLAFPSMKSESITKFLNQKVDLETLKKAIKKEK